MALFLGTSSTVSINENFATGMNGDEDLGEDITMKGDKFHFNQYVQMEAEPAANATAAANVTAAAQTRKPRKARCSGARNLSFFRLLAGCFFLSSL